MTTSTAIRTLSCFANEKIIVVDGRKIKIIDEEKLQEWYFIPAARQDGTLPVP